MLTGHNSEVEYAGRTYHVQTEDKGRKNPVIETLIYSKGEIIDAVRSSYADLGDADFNEQELIRRLADQHRRCLRDVRSGRYDSEAVGPFADPSEPERSLDELVLAVLETSAGANRLRLELVTEVSFFEGTSVIVDLVAKTGDESTPAGGTVVRAELVAPPGPSLTLFEGKCGEDGRLALVVEVPDLAGTPGEVLITAASEEGTAELRRPVEQL